MRPKGIIAFLLILLLLAGIGYFLSGKFIERGLESMGESAVGAKVEIDNLQLNLATLSISLDRLQVTNPNDTWENLFETGRMSFDMEVEPLSRKKIIINDVTLAGVRIGTTRATDGAIPQKPGTETPGWFEKASESLKKQVAAAPVLNLGILKRKVNIDSIFSLVKISSPARMDKARQNADATFRKWRTELDSFKPKEDLARLESQINELKSQKVNNLEQMVSTLTKAKSTYETLDKLKKEIGAEKKAISSDLNNISNTLAQVDNWIEDDFNAVKSKANIGDFTPQNVGKMLFGETIVLPVLGFMKYVDLTRKYMPVAQQLLATNKTEKPPRFKGQDIRYPLKIAQPDFLMEHLLVSTATNQQDTSQALRVSGEMAGLASQPRLYGRPLTFDLKAQLPQSRAFGINGEFDHTTDVAKDRIEIKASGVRFGDIQLPDRPYLPARISASTGNLSADMNFIDDEFEFNLNLAATPVQFHFPQQKTNDDVIAKVTQSVFTSIDRLQISAGISGRIDNPNLTIRSNVDDILSQRIQAMIGESARAARREIQKRLTSITRPKKQDLLAFVNENQKQISGEIDQLQKSVDEKLALVRQKRQEIEQKIAKEKKKGIDKLKNIFKKND